MRRKGRSAADNGLSDRIEGQAARTLRRKIEFTGEGVGSGRLSLLDDNIEDLKKYLYYISEAIIKKIGPAENATCWRF